MRPEDGNRKASGEPNTERRLLSEHPMARALFVSFVEDERVLYADVLSYAGFEVRAIGNPIESLAVATDWRPDVVIARILQPGCPIDGLELARRLRHDSRTRHAAILLITSLIGTIPKTAAVESGADCFLLLPSLPDDFVREVRRILRSSKRPRRGVATCAS